MTDDLVKRPDDEQDDLTLVYMWAYKMAEKKYKARIEQLEAALREISHMHDGNPSPAMADMPDVDYARFVLGEARRVARAALEEKKDG